MKSNESTPKSFRRRRRQVGWIRQRNTMTTAAAAAWPHRLVAECTKQQLEDVAVAWIFLLVRTLCGRNDERDECNAGVADNGQHATDREKERWQDR